MERSLLLLACLVGACAVEEETMLLQNQDVQEDEWPGKAMNFKVPGIKLQAPRGKPKVKSAADMMIQQQKFQNWAGLLKNSANPFDDNEKAMQQLSHEMSASTLPENRQLRQNRQGSALESRTRAAMKVATAAAKIGAICPNKCSWRGFGMPSGNPITLKADEEQVKHMQKCVHACRHECMSMCAHQVKIRDVCMAECTGALADEENVMPREVLETDLKKGPIERTRQLFRVPTVPAAPARFPVSSMQPNAKTRAMTPATNPKIARYITGRAGGPEEDEADDEAEYDADAVGNGDSV